MANIFYRHPDLATHATRVAKVRETPEGRQAVSVEENILRPAGGGQPQDHGTLSSGEGEAPVGRVFKADGETWIEVGGLLRQPMVVGQAVTLALDMERRTNLSRCHSLTHLGMATVKALMSGYEGRGADIRDDAGGATLFFRGDHVPDARVLYEIDTYMRSLVFKAAPIHVEKAGSMEDAARTYSCWRVDAHNQLSGRVRVIHIEGIDANPCSGSHVAHTGAIGPYVVSACRVDGRGVIALELSRLNVWMSC